MSTALVTQTDVNLDDLKRMASLLVASGYFTGRADDRNTAIAQLATKILAGRELGYGPFVSVNGIHVIQGKPQVSANLMAAAVKAHPRYDYRVTQMEDTIVTVRFFQEGQPIGDSTFTAEDAKRAATQNMGKFPRNMLFSRALSNGVRWFTPDVFYGNTVYVEGEIGEDEVSQPAYIVVDKQTGEVLEPPPTITRLDDVTALDFDSIPSPAEGQTAQQAAAPVKMGEKTRKHFHAVGVKLYGDEWEDKRHEIVKAITKGAAESSNDLTEVQAKTLIAGMEKRIPEAQAAEPEKDEVPF